MACDHRVFDGGVVWGCVVDVAQLVVGVLVLWAPGLAWTWALVEGLDWAKFLFLSVVVAFTVQPGVMYIVHVFFGFPLTVMNTVLLSVGLALLGLAWALRPRLEAAWA